MKLQRRDFLQLAALGGGAISVAGLAGCASRPSPADEFYFVQLSDIHWGFNGPPNPDARGTLPKVNEGLRRVSRNVSQGLIP